MRHRRLERGLVRHGYLRARGVIVCMCRCVRMCMARTGCCFVAEIDGEAVEPRHAVELLQTQLAARKPMEIKFEVGRLTLAWDAGARTVWACVQVSTSI